MMKRIFLIVLDSVGIGNAPDASEFGDAGANTLKRISGSPRFSVPNLCRLGLGGIDGVTDAGKGTISVSEPTAAVARLREKSRGKDTTVGHWELSGVISAEPLPTYPEGFPAEVTEALERATGRGILCNKPYSGTEVIKDYGEEHLRTGKLIVYTSADSVLQIAAHENLIPPEKLYEICRKARSVMSGKHAVGRVIARPFVGEPGNFTRTGNRRDFSVEASGKTVLDALKEAGLDVISVGKISDVFAGRGITKAIPAHNNEEGIEGTLAVMKTDFHGLCFTNLVDFDMLYGHRQDVEGYAAAMTEFDRRLPELLAGLREDDLLMITADHGCDPGDNSTDHTRESVPLLIAGAKVRAENYGTFGSFTTVGRFAAETLGVPFCPPASEPLDCLKN